MILANIFSNIKHFNKCKGILIPETFFLFSKKKNLFDFLYFIHGADNYYYGQYMPHLILQFLFRS